MQTLFDTRAFSLCPDLDNTDQRYTPLDIVDRCASALGGIGLDPTANLGKTVPALHHITERENCFVTSWVPLLCELPTVFMNPPFSNSAPFIVEMCRHIEDGVINRAITLALTSVLANKSTQPLVKRHAVAVCHPYGRINFIGGKPGSTNDRDVVFILWGRCASVAMFRQYMEGLVCVL